MPASDQKFLPMLSIYDILTFYQNSSCGMGDFSTMITNIDLDSYLRDNGIMPSQQRLRIARVIIDNSNEMSAEEVYRNVNGPWPPVSRATVNNTLRLFVEKGILEKGENDDAEIYHSINPPAQNSQDSAA